MLKFTHFNGDENKSGYLEIDIKCYYPWVNSQSVLHLILKTKAGGWREALLGIPLIFFQISVFSP